MGRFRDHCRRALSNPGRGEPVGAHNCHSAPRRAAPDACGRISGRPNPQESPWGGPKNRQDRTASKTQLVISDLRYVVDRLAEFYSPDEASIFRRRSLANRRKGRDPLRGSTANGRWSPSGGEFEVLFTSLERDGALAEI